MFSKIIRSLIKQLFFYIEQLVYILLNIKGESTALAVFIIGPPRSGTTLLYQSLVNRYTFSYFSNFTKSFYHTPVIATWISKIIPKKKEQPNNFTSQYGKTEDRWGPYEAGEFWYRWFPKGRYVYVPSGVTPKSHLSELRQSFVGMCKVTNAPVLLKNTYNSMRIAPIVEAIPEACFLVCHRSPIDIAQSILNARIKTQGDKEQWWALPPKEIDIIEQHPYWEQIVEQVYYTYQQIAQDKEQFEASYFYHINYEQLCKDPQGTLLKIEYFLKQKGIKLHIQNKLPIQFPFSTGQKVDDEDYQLLVQTINKLWSENY